MQGYKNRLMEEVESLLKGQRYRSPWFTSMKRDQEKGERDRISNTNKNRKTRYSHTHKCNLILIIYICIDINVNDKTLLIQKAAKIHYCASEMNSKDDTQPLAWVISK